MLHRSQKISVIISMALIFLLLLALFFVAYFLPGIVNSLIETNDMIGNRQAMSENQKLFVLVDAYCMIAVAFVAAVLLYFLLFIILKGRVFSKSTARLLSAISWCCFAITLLSALLLGFFQLASFLGIGTAFVGLCLRIVKHVIEEATRIKAENDFTI